MTICFCKREFVPLTIKGVTFFVVGELKFAKKQYYKAKIK